MREEGTFCEGGDTGLHRWPPVPRLSVNVPVAMCAEHPGRVCHRVKAMEYHPNGTLKRVELHDAGGGFVGRERFWESETLSPTSPPPEAPPKVRNT